MHTTDSLASIGTRIQEARRSGRICGLIGLACRVRVLRLARLVEAGRLDTERALRLAVETEAVAFCLPPLPEGQP